MRRAFGIILIAIILAVVGGVCLLAGRFERRMAIAQEDMAVLDFADPQQDYARLEEDLGKLPWTSTERLREIRHRRAELQYWQKDYDTLVEIAKAPPTQGGDADAADPELLLMAANASFRAAQHGPQDKAT